MAGRPINTRQFVQSLRNDLDIIIGLIVNGQQVYITRWNNERYFYDTDINLAYRFKSYYDEEYKDLVYGLKYGEGRKESRIVLFGEAKK